MARLPMTFSEAEAESHFWCFKPL